jgi:predicted RNase H-like HicB family nuclease
MKLSIECERETDGRWIAEIVQIPGAMAYGATRDEAMAKAEVVALRAIADRNELAIDPGTPGLGRTLASGMDDQAPERFTPHLEPARLF